MNIKKIKNSINEVTRKRKKDSKPNAGIVVVKQDGDKYSVLCLVKHDGSLDITKGLKNKNESSLDAAVRETFEESGIFKLDFKWGLKSLTYGLGTVFVAETSQEPVILPNPESGKYEHVDYKWMSIDDAIKNENMKGYLIPALLWARKTILEI